MHYLQKFFHIFLAPLAIFQGFIYFYVFMEKCK
jgi:hypothetical protein